MKKLIALLLAMMMVLAVPFAACAEEAETEMPFEGEWYDLGDYVIYLPVDLEEVELTDEMSESGIYYALASADKARSIQFAYKELENEVTTEQLVSGFQESFGEENVFTIEANDMTFVYYVNTENDATCFLFNDPNALGLYMIVFVPASDGDFMENAGSIIATIAFNEVEEETE